MRFFEEWVGGGQWLINPIPKGKNISVFSEIQLLATLSVGLIRASRVNHTNLFDKRSGKLFSSKSPVKKCTQGVLVSRVFDICRWFISRWNLRIWWRFRHKYHRFQTFPEIKAAYSIPNGMGINRPTPAWFVQLIETSGRGTFPEIRIKWNKATNLHQKNDDNRIACGEQGDKSGATGVQNGWINEQEWECNSGKVGNEDASCGESSLQCSVLSMMNQYIDIYGHTYLCSQCHEQFRLQQPRLCRKLFRLSNMAEKDKGEYCGEGDTGNNQRITSEHDHSRPKVKLAAPLHFIGWEQ